MLHNISVSIPTEIGDITAAWLEAALRLGQSQSHVARTGISGEVDKPLGLPCRPAGIDDVECIGELRSVT